MVRNGQSLRRASLDRFVAAHKKHVIVAAVAKFPDNVPRNIDTFHNVLDFLTGIRDGGSSPDVFYLGQLPGRTGRYCARLDSFHTIEIPDPRGRSGILTSPEAGILDGRLPVPRPCSTFEQAPDLPACCGSPSWESPANPPGLNHAQRRAPV
jgi:hypothetical protein